MSELFKLNGHGQHSRKSLGKKRVSSMRLLIACILALTCAPADAAPATAKASTTTSYSERMALLSKLVGDWRGSGWMIMPNGKRESFVSQEIVSRRLSGNALLVEGQHRSATGQLIHDAMAMITWNERTGEHRMRTALSSGFGGDFPLKVTPGGFTWRMSCRQAAQASSAMVR